MTSRNVLAIVFLGMLAFSSIGCPNKQKDGGASTETASSTATATATNAATGDDKDDDKDVDDEDKDTKDDKKDEGGW